MVEIIDNPVTCICDANMKNETESAALRMIILI